LLHRYDENLTYKAICEFTKTASNQSKLLYDVNKEVYSLLRFCVTVQPGIAQNRKTVWLIDWKIHLPMILPLLSEGSK
jgi:type I restriction enzyme R subunit